MILHEAGIKSLYLNTLNDINILKYYICIFSVHDEFRELLNKQTPIEGYTEWIDEVVDKCVIKV